MENVHLYTSLSKFLENTLCTIEQWQVYLYKVNIRYNNRRFLHQECQLVSALSN